MEPEQKTKAQLEESGASRALTQATEADSSIRLPSALVTAPRDDGTTCVVGASGRYPGPAGAEGLSVFWHCLAEGLDLPRLMPLQRWDIEQLYHADAAKEGSMNVRLGGFIDNVDEFDPGMFR